MEFGTAYRIFLKGRSKKHSWRYGGFCQSGHFSLLAATHFLPHGQKKSASVTKFS
jgi:hypothetical protein